MQSFQRARASTVALLTGVLACMGGALRSIPANAAPPTAESPAIEPAAKESLERMVEYLRSLEAFAVHAETTREAVVNYDFKLQKSGETDVVFRRPDRLRAYALNDEGGRTFVYDGKSVALHVDPGNYLATVEAPPTTREMLDTMLDRYGVELPILDILYVAAGGDLGSAILDAGDIGASLVGGVECEHLAFRGAKTDWQVWVERGAHPLPRKVVVTTRDNPMMPEFTALLRWDLSPTVDATTFQFQPPAGAQTISFKPLADSSELRPPSTRKKSPAKAQ